MFFLPQRGWLWVEKDSQHAENSMKDDKRLFTSGVWANGAGDTAFMDFITKGKTERSLPSSSVRAKYPKFKYQYTRNHWASRETKQQGTLRLWNHVVAAKAAKLGITVEEEAKVTKIVLMLDCWPVNLTAEYRDFVKANCPGIRLMFIPAGGTGRFQVGVHGASWLPRLTFLNSLRAIQL